MPGDRGEYRPIYVALLDGPDFQALGAEERWVLVTLKLSLGMLGIAVLPGLEAALAERTGLPARRVARALATLAGHWIEREKNVIWLTRGFKFEPSMSPSNQLHRTSVSRAISTLPSLPIVERFKKAYREWFDTEPTDQTEPLDSPSIPSLNTEPETEPETIPEPLPEPSKSTAVATNGKHPRNLETVRAHLSAILTDVASESERRKDAEQMRRVQAELVFAYWAAKMGHPKALLDRGREQLLMERLGENQGDVHELLYVVDGARKDDWTMGRTSRSSTKYDGIETIYQDRAHVEKFAALCPGHKRGDPHPMAVKYLQIGAEVVHG